MSNFKAAILALIFVASVNYSYGIFCGNTDVRNRLQNLEVLRNCTVISGHLHVVLIGNNKTSDWEKYTFPNLREVTHYLLFYRVNGLTDIRKLFPNLRVIRGLSLLREYALAIYDNTQINDISLFNETTILRGSVQISGNLNLCCIDTVRWDKIVEPENIKGNFIQDDGIFCPSCKEYSSKEKSIPFEKCHPFCLSGCFKENDPGNCFACKNYFYKNRCFEKCPENTFIFENHTCITAIDCLKYQKFIKADECVHVCPQGYEISKNLPYLCEKCSKTCPKVCRGMFLRDRTSIQVLKGCTIINGSLEISLENNERAIGELIKSLKDVVEIRGFLKVDTCTHLKSLEFFENLEIIYGQNNNGIIVYGNDNLTSLFNWHKVKNLTIKNEKVIFQRNSYLCLEEIYKLLKVAGISRDFPESEISDISNGNLAVCSHDHIDTRFAVINSTTVLLEWEPYLDTPTESHILSAYLVWYQKTNKKNLNKTFTQTCNEGWRADTVILSELKTNKNDNYLMYYMTSLEPYMQYGYFVQTHFTIKNEKAINKSRNIGAVTDIKYFRTFSDRPERPPRIKIYSPEYDQLVVIWRPPKFINGQLSHYVLNAFISNDELQTLPDRNYCVHPMEKSKEKPREEQLAEDFDKPLTKDEEVRMYLDQLDTSIKFIDEVVEEPIVTEGINVIYSAIIEPDKTSHVIKKLATYSIYHIYVLACNYLSEKGKEICGTSHFEYLRTKPRQDADQIKHYELISESNHMKTIKWEQPEVINKIILTYTIEIKNRIDDSVIKLKCMTGNEALQKHLSYKFSIKNPGKYKFRIRAQSLADFGPWTEWTEFDITSLFYTYLILMIALVVVCTPVSYYYVRRYLRNRWPTPIVIYQRDAPDPDADQEALISINEGDNANRGDNHEIEHAETDRNDDRGHFFY